METISFDEFQKLKIQVAKVIEAERVEGSDKLIKLQIRIGEENRTLVAGIAEQYAEDELLGKKIIVIVNLEPRAFRGVESQGMLLAAESPDGELSLLSLDRDVPDGTEVH